MTDNDRQMDARRTDSGRLRAISSAGRLVEFVVTPPTGGGEDLPRASVATWVLTHFCVVVMFGLPVIAVGWDRSCLWAVLVLLGWLAMASGLCFRLLLLLIGRSGRRPSRLAPRRRVPPELKLGFFAFASTAGFIAAQELGWFVVVGFLATVAVTSGLRLAGLDALTGQERRRLYYLSSIFSLSGLLVLGSLALVMVVLFTATGALVNSSYRGMEETVEDWLGVDLRRRAQLQVLLGWLALSPAVALVCEAVSAVSRYESGLNRRLIEHERREERDRIAQALHDGHILSALEDLRRRSDGPDQRRLITRLEFRLRQLQIERSAERGPRSVRSCLRQPLRGANLLGVVVHLDAEAATLDAELPDAAGSLVERLAMVQINNSSAAGAGSARLGIDDHPHHLLVTYIDDGGGFDPAEIERAGGGMSRLQYDIEQAGGTVSFERRSGGTVSRAEIRRPAGPVGR